MGAPIFESTCGCSFVSNYPYAIGPRLGVAYQINPKTVFRGGWGIAYGFAPDINIQNTADVTNTPTGVNAFLPLNTPGTIPQPVWPNFSASQTPLPGATTSGFLAVSRSRCFAAATPEPVERGRAARDHAQHGDRSRVRRQPRRVVDRALGYSEPGFARGVRGLRSVAVFQPGRQSAAGQRAEQRGGHLPRREPAPYSGYATTNTLINALRPFPQFSTIGVTNSPTGRTWYDSLQMKGTKRLSHGLAGERHVHLVQGHGRTFAPTCSCNPTSRFKPTDQPFLFNANILYTTQKLVQQQGSCRQVTRDWGLGAFLQYGSGLPLAPPAATNTNYIGGSEQYRVPGQPLYIKNLNCGCINPYTDVVLNPAAWANPANGTFGPATGTYYGDFRSARRPQENFNFGRTFRFKENRMAFQIRAEFVNIFNRTQIGNPSTTAPAARAQQERGGPVLAAASAPST